ncbi:MAG TPA: hypothetical protein VNI54_10350 [Thermoanaerobaculia bacterium]|nr:hypothetical protein [Thermoanaerobaculia bacterium]
MQRELSMKVIAPVLERNREAAARVTGFQAWSVAQQPGLLAMREQLDQNSSRAVWDLESGRIGVTVTEHASTAAALNALADDLEANQLAELPRGPEGLGEISFVHPPPAPPAVFFARANLTVAVYSFGREPVDVIGFAQRVDAEISAQTQGGGGSRS